MRYDVLAVWIYMVVLAVHHRDVTSILCICSLGSWTVVYHRAVFPSCSVSRERISFR